MPNSKAFSIKNGTEQSILQKARLKNQHQLQHYIILAVLLH
jgi:hypothetical protein